MYITFIAEGSFAAKWHLNRSQFGRLLPDPDGVIGCSPSIKIRSSPVKGFSDNKRHSFPPSG
ncbi:hypothetical protein, partial [Escherichia coli]|uniref:hypothetical protein n=1 Tax=Escherichia coli TaxID=562 RepID=UPI001BC8A2DC